MRVCPPVLHGVRVLPSQAEPQITRHFAARVHLGRGRAARREALLRRPGDAAGYRPRADPLRDLLPRPGLPGPRRSLDRRRSHGRCLPARGGSSAEPRAGGGASADGAASDRALLPDRRTRARSSDTARLGLPQAIDSVAVFGRPGAREGAALRGRHSARRRERLRRLRRRRHRVRSSFAWRDTGPSRCPAASPRRCGSLAPLRAAAC